MEVNTISSARCRQSAITFGPPITHTVSYTSESSANRLSMSPNEMMSGRHPSRVRTRSNPTRGDYSVGSPWQKMRKADECIGTHYNYTVLRFASEVQHVLFVVRPWQSVLEPKAVILAYCKYDLDHDFTLKCKLCCRYPRFVCIHSRTCCRPRTYQDRTSLTCPSVYAS